MVSKIRLMGRSLLIGAVPLFCLTLSVCVLLIFSLGLMPLVYRSSVMSIVNSTFAEKSAYINLAVAAAILFIISMSYSALKTGSDRYMLKKAQKVSAGTKDIFFYFAPKNLFSLLFISFRTSVLRVLVFAFLNIPTVLCSLLLLTLSRSRFSAAVGAVLAAGCAVFFISSFWFYFRLTSSLFLVRYYFIKGEYINFRHLIASSQSAMHGKVNELCKLRLSFLGWFISCIFILPIGYVWGYYKQTMAAWANEIMKLQ
ncbi:MAG: hypothetical protein IJW86_06895 [Clostridia bacterium]|nr:hypothetical protein [Clostridia bacterium]